MRNNMSSILIRLVIFISLIQVIASYKITVEDWKTRKPKDIEVKDKEQIRSLKNRIEKVFNIPVNQQRITYNGELLNDNLTIADYNLRKDDFLWLANPLIEEMGMVYARTTSGKNRELIALKVGANDTIGQIVKAIEANNKNNLTHDKMKLFFQGKELSDYSKTALYYNLYAESWIDIKVNL